MSAVAAVSVSVAWSVTVAVNVAVSVAVVAGLYLSLRLVATLRVEGILTLLACTKEEGRAKRSD